MAGLSELKVLAHGGYSTVYSAWQASMSRQVALKIDTRRLDSERDRRRFLREAQTAGQMSGHPHIVHVYDAGVTDDNHPYLVMELCTGGSYAAKIKAGEKLPALDAIAVGVAIADALEAAHRVGILHRDVKPANILINRYGVAGLADFGLAAVFDASRDVSVTVESLTPAYAAPEVFRFEQPTRAGDIYSLAATVYALMAGKPPRWPDTGSPSPVQLIALHREPLPRLSHIPPALFAVLERGMAFEPAARYGTVGELRSALLRARDAITARNEPGNVGQAAPPPTSSPQPAALPVPRPAAYVSQPGSPSPAISTPPVGQQLSVLSAPPGGYPLTVRERPQSSRVLPGVLAMLLAVIVIAGTVVLLTQDPQGQGSGAATCGIQTQQARCVDKPECFAEASRDNQGFGTAAAGACDRPHAWETFVIAKVPSSVPNPNYDELQKNRYVQAMCSAETLSRFGVDVQRWHIRLLPPASTQVSSGNTEFRCLAGADPASSSARFVRH